MTTEQVIAAAAEEIVNITAKEDYSKLIKQAATARESMHDFLIFSTKIGEKEEASKEITENLIQIYSILENCWNNDRRYVLIYLELFYLNILNSTKN